MRLSGHSSRVKSRETKNCADFQISDFARLSGRNRGRIDTIFTFSRSDAIETDRTFDDWQSIDVSPGDTAELPNLAMRAFKPSKNLEHPPKEISVMLPILDSLESANESNRMVRGINPPPEAVWQW